MKRTLATMGAVGLAALVVAAPATADAKKITICHVEDGTYKAISVAASGLNGHGAHGADIIPPNDDLEGGRNWDSAGRKIYDNNCVVAPVDNPPVDNPPVDNPPVDNPPVDNPPVDNPPVDNPPVDNPPADNPPVDNPPVDNPPANNPPAGAPAVQAPAAPPVAAPAVVPVQPAPAAVQQPAGAAAAAPVSSGTNQGYNAQTAVGDSATSPAWLGGVGALVAAGAAVTIRRRGGQAPQAR